MKRFFFLFLCILLCAALLGACSGFHAGSGLLEFPGTDWAMTPEQVQKALNVPGAPLEGGVLTVENADFFGAQAQQAEFRFTADSKGQLRLSFIQLVYPDDADMAQVRKALEKDYGPSLETYEEFDHDQALRTVTATDHLAFWHSRKTMADQSADPSFPLREDWQVCLDAMQKQDDEAGMQGALMEFYNRSPVVQLFWTDSGQLPYLAEENQPKNTVVFDATLLSSMR